MRSPALGLAVQDAAEIALKDRNLDVVIDHHGHDFTVTAPTPESALEDASDRFEVGPFFVEVKATRSGRARLTPTQADMASARQSSYVLCVVDLTGVDETRLDGAWAAADVESLASLVPDIGGRVNETCCSSMRRGTTWSGYATRARFATRRSVAARTATRRRTRSTPAWISGSSTSRSGRLEALNKGPKTSSRSRTTCGRLSDGMGTSFAGGAPCRQQQLAVPAAAVSASRSEPRAATGVGPHTSRPLSPRSPVCGSSTLPLLRPAVRAGHHAGARSRRQPADLLLLDSTLTLLPLDCRCVSSRRHTIPTLLGLARGPRFASHHGGKWGRSPRCPRATHRVH
jgi:hypothetical protein